MRASRANAAFWLAWLGLAAWCHFNCFDDPSSLFFDPGRAYRPRYSAVRAAEVARYLRLTASTAPTTPPASPRPLLCVGMPSLNRTTRSFVEQAVGSLVDSLTPAERQLVHLVVLLADGDARAHAAYGQPWLGRLPDEVLVYANASDLARDAAPPNHVAVADAAAAAAAAAGPDDDARVRKMRLDHALLVEHCRARAAPYFALVEDDVVAARDWFARFRSAVAHVDAQARRFGRDWIYLRLFHSELLMGWNAEEWLSYARTIATTYALVVVLVLFLELLRRRRRRRRLAAAFGPSAAKASAHSFNCLCALALGLWTPALIALVFMAGRVSMRRLSPLGSSSGVREMPDYGCCAQGLVIPERHLAGLQELLRTPPFAFAGDQMLEDYARDRRLAKWALDPSVLQHVGRVESSDGPRVADVWNFSFERQRR